MNLGTFGNLRICLNSVTEAERLAMEPFAYEIVWQNNGRRGAWVYTPDGWQPISPNESQSVEGVKVATAPTLSGFDK